MGTWDRWKKDENEDPYVRWDAPGRKFEAVITRITSTDFGDPNKGPIPVITGKTREGREKILNVSQTVLLNRLVELAPEVGDHIEITYTGDANKSMPGRNPAKLFDVVVTPAALLEQESPPPSTDSPETTAGAEDPF